MRWMKARPQMAYEGIGVSLPGRVDLSSQKFVFAPNLGWHEEDLKGTAGERHWVARGPGKRGKRLRLVRILVWPPLR